MTQADATWTTLKVLTWTTGYLTDKGVENARREAEWLLCEATGLDRVGLYLAFDKPLHDDELAAYRALVARRGKREPLQHILGTQEFDGLTFDVSPAVLIPRHDTETLIEAALQQVSRPRTVLDVGTGSGCIAISLAHRLPEAFVSAVDISPEALAVAARNVQHNGVSVELLHGSYFEPVGDRRFDLIVSNPPYITSSDLAALQPEVRDFEPRLALDGGADGLDAYRVLVSQASAYLQPDGWLFVEVGAGQASSLVQMLAHAGFRDVTTASDPGGIERVVGGRHGA